MTEEQKFVAWFEREKAKGLVDFKVTMNPSYVPGSVSREELCRQLNQVVECFEKGEVVEREDVF